MYFRLETILEDTSHKLVRESPQKSCTATGGRMRPALQGISSAFCSFTLACEDLCDVKFRKVPSLSMASDLQALAQVLEASLDPTKNKQGGSIQNSYNAVPQS